MRAFRRPVAGLLLAAVIVGAGTVIDASSGYAAGGASLAVSPSEGSPQAQFTVTYRWPSTRARKHAAACVPDQITFKWDGALLGHAASTLARDSCVAALNATAPPGGSDARTHTITVAEDASAHATYLVTGDPAGTPSAGASDSTDPPVDPQMTGAATPADAAGPTGLTTEQQGGGSGMMGWLIVFGALLVLAGVGMFGFIIWRTRRPEPDAQAPWSPGDMDTQPIAVQDRAARRSAHRAHRRYRR
jgi:hypothetical protein